MAQHDLNVVIGKLATDFMLFQAHTFPEQMKVCHEFEAAEAAAEGRRPSVDGLLTFKCLFYD